MMPKKPITPDDPRHGTLAGYNAEYKQLGGRAGTCPACREAERRYQNQRSKMRAYGRPISVPAIGTNRRLQALMAIGWTGTYLSERLGVKRGNLRVNPKYPSVNIKTANAVKALYEELVVCDGPSMRTRTRAEKRGWATPDQWLGRDMDDPAATPAQVEAGSAELDEVAVERAVKLAQQGGERLSHTRAEMVALIRKGDQLGIPRNATQKYLKVNGSVFMGLVREAEKESA